MTVHTVEVAAWSNAPQRLLEPPLGAVLDLLQEGLAPTPFLLRLLGMTLLPEGGGNEPVGEAWIRQQVGASRLPGFRQLGMEAMRICGLPPAEDGAAPPNP